VCDNVYYNCFVYYYCQARVILTSSCSLSGFILSAKLQVRVCVDVLSECLSLKVVLRIDHMLTLLGFVPGPCDSGTFCLNCMTSVPQLRSDIEQIIELNGQSHKNTRFWVRFNKK